MPHRRHRPPFGQADAAMFGGPIGQSLPWEFRPPAEPPRQWRKGEFENAARAAFGADVFDQLGRQARRRQPDRTAADAADGAFFPDPLPQVVTLQR